MGKSGTRQEIGVKVILGLLLSAAWGNVAASPYAYFPSAVDRAVRVVDTVTKAVVAAIANFNNPAELAFSEDGTRVYLLETPPVPMTAPQKIVALSSTTHQQVAEYPIFYPSVSLARVGQTLVAVGPGQVIHYVDLGTGEGRPITDIICGGCDQIVENPSGNLAYIPTSISYVSTPSLIVGIGILVLDMATKSYVGFIPTPTRATGMSLSVDGARLYAAFGTGQVAVYSTATRAQVGTIAAQGRTVRPSPDGTRLVVSDTSNNAVRIIELATGNSLAIASVTQPLHADFTPDGSQLYVSTGTGNAVVLDGNTYAQLVAIPVGNGQSTGAKFIGAYAFGGLTGPIDPPPTVNTMRAGGTVPVKFSLGGYQGLNIMAAGYPQSQTAVCSSTSPVDAVELTTTPGRSRLQYDLVTDTYAYAWKTDRAWANTCRVITIKLIDGTSFSALFSFT